MIKNNNGFKWFKERPNYKRHIVYGLLKGITGKKHQRIYREFKDKGLNILEEEDVVIYIKEFYKTKYM